jgi:hypothetical protein
MEIDDNKATIVTFWKLKMTLRYILLTSIWNSFLQIDLQMTEDVALKPQSV